jgi:2-oxoglutarate dehydrogenase E1 component
MDREDHIEGQIANLAYLEHLYREFEGRSKTIDPSWKQFFQHIHLPKSPAPVAVLSSKEEKILHLIEAYRRWGHLLAAINPIALEAHSEITHLSLGHLGFTPQEKEESFPTQGLLNEKEAPLKGIEEALRKLYCGTVGFEFKGFTDPTLEQWMQEQIESGRFGIPFSADEKKMILDFLTRAEVLETFLHTKHVGKKRFSLEGSDSLIPMLQFLITKAAEGGVKEIFIGMSHRGRLNVLANVLNKPISSILNDFDDDYEPNPEERMGDIRYHKGHANEAVKTFKGHPIKLSVAPNPSHLESVNSVIEGEAHAKQFLTEDEKERRGILPLLMHGDGAIAGQGVIYETLQMSKLPGFETGGTLHFVINNQIGFTTTPQEGRSTLYCTDIARTFGMPVLHINAEDPENCVRAALFALEIREKFHVDVFIDHNGYRKYGHNEGDEPSFTQPLEYKLIRGKKTIRNLYVEQLVQEGIIDQKTADEKEGNFKKSLQDAFESAQVKKKEKTKEVSNPIKLETVETKVDLKLLQEVATQFATFPSDFHLNPKIAQLMKEREKAVKEDKSIDWGNAEFLAYGSLAWEGIPVRLAGQDSGRGTFSHRHALCVDQENSQAYYPLNHLREGQGRFEVLNTCLSEAAALGFEYGYSTVCKQGLTLWEAQFGDFVNSAQVMIDQYIASGEQKWGQTSGLVMLLPHGLEGQGPEHSSARLERFLSLAADDNIQVVNPSLPAQLFHLLRRQVKQSFRKPLIVMTPKGLLRHPACQSPVKEFTEGAFYPILNDPRKLIKARRLVLCCGRIYYDLDEKREKEKRDDVAIIRIEQLYPLDHQNLKEIIASYSTAKEYLWVQEEPQNMGAWPYLSSRLPELLPETASIKYVGRKESASPATGFSTRHKQELTYILNQVFGT